MLRNILLALLLIAGLQASDGLADDEKLPVPRFASLAASVINVRTGPGKQYPIRWVYHRYGYPVKIVEDFDNWRRIEDAEGDGGWVHRSLLSGRRTAVIETKIAALRRTPSPQARVVLQAEGGVIGQLLECDLRYCLLEVDGTRAWLERHELWGLLETEQTLDLN